MLKVKLLLGILFVLFCQNGFARGFTPNVQVNDVVTGEQSTDGKQLIATLGDSVYVVWGDMRAQDTTDVYFAKSTDGGETFGSSVKVSSIPDTVQQIWPSLEVDDSGVIYVTWSMLSLDLMSTYGIWFTKSTNGGVSFESAVRVDSFGILPAIAVYGSNVYVLFADPSGYPFVDFYFARSTNGGTSFEPSYKINDAPCQDTAEISNMTALCVDESGNIYAAWNDGRRDGANGDIFFAKSSDDGISFGTNVSVNDTTSPAGDSVQSHPSITVGGTDTVYVVWHDCRDDERIYFAKSTNGGMSFDADVPVSDTVNESMCRRPSITTFPTGEIYVAYDAFSPSAGGENIWCTMSNDGGESFVQSLAVADTFNCEAEQPSIAIGFDENAYLVWSDNRLGNKDVYFAKGVVGGIEENDVFPVPMTLGLIECTPNPFTVVTSIKYVLPKDAHIELAIYNVQGQLIRTLTNGTETAGIHSVSWNGKDDKGRNVNSGVYFYQLKESTNVKETKKVLLLR
jgi:hypothetical protein